MDIDSKHHLKNLINNSNKRKLSDVIKTEENSPTTTDETKKTKTSKCVNPFICKLANCRLYLETPIILPCCGSSVCQEHQKEMISHKSRTYRCPICDEKCPAPKNGFPLNQSLLELIKNKDYLNKLSHGHKNAFESYIKLESLIAENQSINADDLVYNYFSSVRNKIDLHKDELVNEINKRHKEILHKLKEHEDECKLNAVKMKKLNFNQVNSQMAWRKNKLREIDLNETQLNDILKLIKTDVKTIQHDLVKFECDVLLNKRVEFIPFKNNYFGELNIIKVSNDFGKLIQSYNGHTEAVLSIQIDGKNNTLITSSDDRTIKIWDMKSGDIVKVLDQHEQPIKNLLLTSSNRQLISSSEDNKIKIWDMDTYDLINTFTSESVAYSSCQISDNQVLLGLNNGMINVFDLIAHSNQKSIKAHEKKVSRLILTIDSLKFISGSDDKKIKMWNAKSFECLKEMIDHKDVIFSLDLTWNGNLLSSSADKTVKEWDLMNDKCVKTLSFDYSAHYIKAISKNLIAIWLLNGFLIIYDWNARKELQKFKVDSQFVGSFSILSNGNLLTSIGKNGVKLWHFLDN